MKKIFFYFSIILFLASCRSLKKVNLYHSLESDNSELTNVQNDYILSSGDVLHIYIQDLDRENYEFLIPQTSQNAIALPNSYTRGMIIRDDGYLKIPYIDSLQVSGLSIKELNDTLTILYSGFIKSPTVHIRLMNYYVSVLGDVMNPGTYTSLEGERYYLHEALAQAGGMKLSGNRNELIIIRKEGNENKKYLINLTAENSIIPNPIPLKRGDLIYVKETRRSYASQDFQLITVALNSIIGILTLYILVNNLK